MEAIEIIEIIGVSVAVIFGIASFVTSCISNKKAKEANNLSNESIAIAKDANLLSEKSLKIAEETSNMQKENIEFESTSNTVILKNIDANNIVFEGEKDYSDFFILLTIQANNKSLQPITINKLSVSMGTGKNSSYIYSGDILNIKSYKNKLVKNIVSFPLYLNGNESKEFSFAIAIDNSYYQQYYAQDGIKVSFNTTNSQKELLVKSTDTIEYL